MLFKRTKVFNIFNDQQYKNNFEEKYHYYTYYDALIVLKNINLAVKQHHSNKIGYL